MKSIDTLNQIRDFKRLSAIGKGPTSIVYKCLNKVDNLIYAIKKITNKIYGNSFHFILIFLDSDVHNDI